MAKPLENLLSTLSQEEQLELKKFAAYLLLRRKFSAEQVLTNDISSAELAQFNAHGGGFDWLAGEPEIYSLDDGEPVQWPRP